MKKVFKFALKLTAFMLFTLNIASTAWAVNPVLDLSNSYIEHFGYGRGTESHPYLIESVDDLKNFSSGINSGKLPLGAYYKLTCDLDLNPGYIFEFNDDKGMIDVKKDGQVVFCIGTELRGKKMYSDEPSGTGNFYDFTGRIMINSFLDDGNVIRIGDHVLNLWIPIGTESNPFEGNFNGGNHKISGIVVAEYPGTTPYGLFGEVTTSSINNKIVKSTISDLYVENTYVNCTNYKACSGGIVGRLSSGTISNCSHKGFVSSLEENGAVSSKAGGIAGRICLGEINNCFNEGTIVSSNCGMKGFSGGIVGVGEYNSLISNCQNKGNVYGTCEKECCIGGIVGYMFISGKIENCRNIGNVADTCLLSGYAKDEAIGGITGHLYFSSAQSCANSGSVICKFASESSASGGVIGKLQNSTIQKSKSDSVIFNESEGRVYSGGVVGLSIDGDIRYCYNKCDIMGVSKKSLVSYVGGISGKIKNSRSQYCYSASEHLLVDSTCNNRSRHIGGLFGYVESYESGSIIQCYFDNGLLKGRKAIGNSFHDRRGLAEGRPTKELLGRRLMYMTTGEGWKDSIWIFRDGCYPDIRF